ncbi:ribonuclease P protein component [Klugiella xanthotipulae]|uniref:ribonuclease P protein component n=1 Tax=Klugiella xanthotipulae TaxID=244735 RepID=UPI0011529CA3|nr:ribonuclease P protein component [Klugiella xanthotipulae]
MLSQEHRIRTAADYRRVVRSGERLRGRFCVGYLVSAEGDAPARFGFIVSRAVGMAHTRNLVRRRLKAITAEFVAEGLSGVDVVYRAYPQAASASFDQLHEDLRRSLEKSRTVTSASVEVTSP